MTKQNRRLREVADHAGVSFITAWRALNAPELVADKTVARVKASAEEIGYVANTVARSLVSSKSGVIGVIVPTLDDSIFADTVQGVSDTLTGTGREILIGLSSYSETEEEDLVKAFLGRQVDGLIVTGGTHTAATRNFLLKSEIPVVEVWDLPSDPIDMVVGFSNYRLAFDATQRLLDAGYRRPAFVTPSHRSRGIERERGYRDCLEKNGLTLRPELSLRSEPTLAGGADAIRTLLSMSEPPDAIFFNGDTMAIGALLESQGTALSVPGDVALMGVHDLDISARVQPPLSTVRVPRYRMGELAAKALIHRFSDPDFTTRENVGFEIVMRETT